MCVSDEIECCILHICICICIFDIYVRVCHEFDIEICMCHQCEYFVFVFVFLCPLPAARVCKNVPHVLPKRGRVVDRDREREREGVKSCMGGVALVFVALPLKCASVALSC